MANTEFDVLADKLRAGRRKRVMSLMTPAGGWTRKDLASLGVSWPPKKGWKEKFINGENPNIDVGELVNGDGI